MMYDGTDMSGLNLSTNVSAEADEMGGRRDAGAFTPPMSSVHIDHAALIAAGLLPHHTDERRSAAEYRALKRALLAKLNAGSRYPNLQSIMVASAVPGEGKTFTGLNLALSLSLEKNCSVVLVDADVVRPHLSTMLGLAGRPGLMELATDDAIPLDRYLLNTDVPNLKVLPAGMAFSDATEILADFRLAAWSAQLRGGKTIFVFDSPPILPTSESKAIADFVDQILLIVRANHTSRSAVMEAIEALGTSRSISLVINQVRNHRSRSYYDYGAYAQRPDEAAQK